MITWVWQHDTRKQRINVAILNAMFTVGAFVTPMLIAASMHSLHGAVWPAYYVLAAAAKLMAGEMPAGALEGVMSTFATTSTLAPSSASTALIIAPASVDEPRVSPAAIVMVALF